MSSRASRRPRRGSDGVRLGIVVTVLAVVGAGRAYGGTCGDTAALPPAVALALRQIERSIDPCGESGQLTSVVEQFRRCAGARYQICIDSGSERNFIELGPETGALPTTITWNPDLSTTLENGCDGDASKPVRRDPTASLLHELVHAVQDCSGLDPAAHELEAVRIENIYRRARNLCQRTRYGEEILPATMVVPCEPSSCQCLTTTTAADRPRIWRVR